MYGRWPTSDALAPCGRFPRSTRTVWTRSRTSTVSSAPMRSSAWCSAPRPASSLARRCVGQHPAPPTHAHASPPVHPPHPRIPHIPQDIFKSMMRSWTNGLFFEAILLSCAGGCPAPLVGHNCALRFSVMAAPSPTTFHHLPTPPNASHPTSHHLPPPSSPTHPAGDAAHRRVPRADSLAEHPLLVRGAHG